ncbi:MAG TPA: GNAT family N-acetyltransferase [Aggregatilineales bacterium]|nr:GNAT family N-acetyltransferase [Aggregatilineales bacterium]
MTVEIREMQPDDATAVAAVIATAWPDEPPVVARIAAAAHRCDHRGWVALDAGRVVGFLDGFTTRAQDGVRRWELDLIAVHPAAQGRGAARGLVSAALEAVQGVDLIRALVRVDNTPMQRVMAQTGFAIEESGPHVLMVADADPDAGASEDTSLLEVVTLTYSGVWVEGAQDLPRLIAARGQAARRGLDVAGAVIPADRAAALDAAQAAGYVRIGEYDWWIKAL